MIADFEEFNSGVTGWARETALMMKNKVANLTNNSKHNYVNYKKTLQQSVTNKAGKKFGMVERVTFPFNKYGFFLARGASRGHKAQANPRDKKDWYGFVFEQRYEKLAEIVSENYANAVVKAMGRQL